VREVRLGRWADLNVSSGVVLRVGRLILRTYPRFVMWAPAGHRPGRLVWAVEWSQGEEEAPVQLGVFTSEAVARACLRQLQAEGRTNLHLNVMNVHQRLADWQWDR
jgi:hypothetical protein